MGNFLVSGWETTFSLRSREHGRLVIYEMDPDNDSRPRVVDSFLELRHPMDVDLDSSGQDGRDAYEIAHACVAFKNVITELVGVVLPGMSCVEKDGK